MDLCGKKVMEVRTKMRVFPAASFRHEGQELGRSARAEPKVTEQSRQTRPKTHIFAENRGFSQKTADFR